MLLNMGVLTLMLSFTFLLIGACARPKATVFEDFTLAQEEEVKLCMLGDLGKGSAHQQMMADALEREDCHRIFFLGDLVYPKGIKSLEDPELENKFLTYYQPLLERNPQLAIGLVLGNHDHAGTPSAWIEMADRYPGFFFPHYYYLMDYGGLCVVALDTSFYYYEKKVIEATQQTRWLTQLQSRLKQCQVKVAITHHPFKGNKWAEADSGWEGAKGGLRLFLKSYVIGNFDLHVAGHVHNIGDDGKDSGTRMLISGTGGETKGHGRAGFYVLTWRPSSPKRIGYRLQAVDTEVSVYDEALQQQQEPPIDMHPYDEVIPRSRVEDPWYVPILRFFGRDY
jgi:hypothetical protein